MIKGIVCIGANGVMGNKGSMPWGDEPLDGEFFRTTTTGHVVVMGRKTFESMGSKPLPNRDNIVVSKTLRDTMPAWDWEPGLRIAPNVKTILSYAGKTDKDVYIIGGAELFKQFLPYIEELYVTTVGDTFEGDTFLPNIHEHYLWETELLDYRTVSVVDKEDYERAVLKPWAMAYPAIPVERTEIKHNEYTLHFRKFTKKGIEKTSQGGQAFAKP